jgi:hypothetical protein
MTVKDQQYWIKIGFIHIICAFTLSVVHRLKYRVYTNGGYPYPVEATSSWWLETHVISTILWSIFGAYQIYYSPLTMKKSFSYLHSIIGCILIFIILPTMCITGLKLFSIRFHKISYLGTFVSSTPALGTPYVLYQSIAALCKNRYLEHGDWMVELYMMWVGASGVRLINIPFNIIYRWMYDMIPSLQIMSDLVVVASCYSFWLIQSYRYSKSKNKHNLIYPLVYLLFVIGGYGIYPNQIRWGLDI